MPRLSFATIYALPPPGHTPSKPAHPSLTLARRLPHPVLLFWFPRTSAAVPKVYREATRQQINRTATRKKINLSPMKLILLGTGHIQPRPQRLTRGDDLVSQSKVCLECPE